MNSYRVQYNGMEKPLNTHIEGGTGIGYDVTDTVVGMEYNDDDDDDGLSSLSPPQRLLQSIQWSSKREQRWPRESGGGGRAGKPGGGGTTGTILCDHLIFCQ